MCGEGQIERSVPRARRAILLEREEGDYGGGIRDACGDLEGAASFATGADRGDDSDGGGGPAPARAGGIRGGDGSSCLFHPPALVWDLAVACFQLRWIDEAAPFLNPPSVSRKEEGSVWPGGPGLSFFLFTFRACLVACLIYHIILKKIVTII
jgi:hypothetical protein